VKEADSIQINIKGVSGSKVGDLRNPDQHEPVRVLVPERA